MTDKQDYFARSESWALDAQASLARSRRTAWIVAGVAVGVAALQAVMFAFLLPLKTVQPVTLLVDRQTGFVETIDPAEPKRIAADEALTQSLLAQYVSAREGFDRATVALDYRRVGLWSTGPARNAYLTAMQGTNPSSPLNVYPAGTVVSVTPKSVSRLSPDTMLVRFETARQDRGGQRQPAQAWISVIRYRFADAPMRFEDRIVNPLGLQVLSYRRDAEGIVQSPPEPAAVPTVRNVYIDGQGRPLDRTAALPARVDGAAPAAQSNQAKLPATQGSGR